MPYTGFRNGLDIQTESAIDKRIYLSKAEMLAAEDNFMLPEQYFCVCKDDGKIYLYDVNNTPENGVGKYRLLDDTFTYTTGEAKENLDKAVAENILSGSNTTKAAIDSVISNSNIDGGLIV